MIWDGTLPRLTAIVIPSIISVFFKEYLHSNTGNFGFRQKNKPPVEAKKVIPAVGRRGSPFARICCCLRTPAVSDAFFTARLNLLRFRAHREYNQIKFTWAFCASKPFHRQPNYPVKSYCRRKN